MATLTPTQASGNAALTYAAASAGGDTVAVGSAQRATVLVRNASGGSVTVTVAAATTCSQGFTHPLVVTCPVGDTEIALTPQYVNSAGNAGLTYSAATSVTVAAVTN